MIKELYQESINDSHSKEDAFMIGFEKAFDLIIQNIRIKVVDDFTGVVTEYLEPIDFLDLMDETYSIDMEHILKLKQL